MEKIRGLTKAAVSGATGDVAGAVNGLLDVLFDAVLDLNSSKNLYNEDELKKVSVLQEA